MSRYGYLDMPKGYTDVGDHPVMATCPDCGLEFTIEREACWVEDGRLMCACGCTELPDDDAEAAYDAYETQELAREEARLIYWDNHDVPHHAS